MTLTDPVRPLGAMEQLVPPVHRAAAGLVDAAKVTATAMVFFWNYFARRLFVFGAVRS